MRTRIVERGHGGGEALANKERVIKKNKETGSFVEAVRKRSDSTPGKMLASKKIS